MKKIGIIDADLLDKGTRFPNLALMKLSAFEKENNSDVSILKDYDNLESYDIIYCSKVFDYTKIPINLDNYNNIIYNGTGFFFDRCIPLEYRIEHIMPDYNLYNNFEFKNLRKFSKSEFYTDHSIGFTSRGCFRKCKFCVNRNKDKSIKWSPVREFYDNNKKYISLLDDNIFACNRWENIFKELNDIDKPFTFRQGLDIRLLTDKKAEYLVNSKYRGDYIFAFDNYDEKEIIINKLKLWKKYYKKDDDRTKFFILTAYKSIDVNDIIELFERIKILMNYNCLPYVMRYKNYKYSKFKDIYINITRWCNQPHMFKKMNFEEFATLSGMGNKYKDYRNNYNKYLKDGYNKGKSWRTMESFKKEYPELANKYFNLKCEGKLDER